MANFNAGAIEATLELDRSPFQRGIQLARQQARDFARQKYEAKLDIDIAGVTAQLATLKAELDALDARRVQPHIDVDTAALMAQIALLQAQLDRLDQTRVDVDTSSMTRGFGMASMSASTLIGLGASIGPALIPGIVGATAALGGLVSMLSIAGGGVAVLGAGLIGNITGVVGAQKDLTAAQDASTAAAAAQAAAQDRVKSALQAVGDAERNLAAARRNAAYSTAQAEQGLRDAHDAARRAQEDLNQARQDAVQRLEDMRDQLRGAALDEEGSELAVRQARLRLQAVMADPTSTMLERQEAKLAYDRAVYQMDQARKKHDELQESVKKAQKAGVNGDAQVVAARERLRQANQRVRQAEQTLSRTRADGARAVADAQRGLARAEEQVAEARKAAAAASVERAAADAKLAEVMGKLDGPAAAFVAALDRAKGAWHDFLDATAPATIGENGVATRFLNIFATYLPMFAPVANAAAEAIGSLMDSFDQWAASGGMKGIADFLEKWGPTMIEGLGKSFGNLALGFGGIVKAFAPFAEQMLGPGGMFEGFATWGQNLSKSDGFRGFMAYVKETGPLFLEVLGKAWDALVNIGKALAPAAVPVLTALGAFLGFIADMDPQTLGMVAGGIMAVVGAIMLLTGAGGIGGVLLLVAGLNIALSNMGVEFEGMGTAMGDLFGWLSEKWDHLWNDTLKPGFHDIAEAIEKDFLPAWESFWPIIKPIVHFVGEVLADTFENAWDAVLDIVEGAVKILGGILDLFTAGFTGDWSKLGDALAKIARGMWDVIRGIFKGAFGGLGAIIKNGVEAIGLSWGGVKMAFARPVNFVIDYVLNPLISGVNWVSDKLGGSPTLIPKIPRISYAGWYESAAGAGGQNAQDKNTGGGRGVREIGAANGTVLPGFLPGQDTIHYKSPTGPDLHLSGGEAIMVPEFTRAVGGAAGVKRLNAAARYGEKAGRFADGGIPAVGDWSQHTSGYPWARWAGDINVPGSGDYGNPVRAWKDGIVAAVTYLGDRSYGRYITVNHPATNEQTLYAHLSAATVSGGDAVKRGDMIGRVGDLGNASGPHLHFEIKGGQGPISTGSGGAGPTGQGYGPNYMRIIDAVQHGWGQLKGLLDNLPKIPGGAFGDMLSGGAFRTIKDAALGWIDDKIPGPSLFDQGGKLMPGYTNVLNLTGKPETVLTDDQWRLARRSMGVDAPIVGSRDGWTREDIERLIEAVRAANPIVVPESDKVGELLAGIGFELRAQDRGGAR